MDQVCPAAGEACPTMGEPPKVRGNSLTAEFVIRLGYGRDGGKLGPDSIP